MSSIVRGGQGIAWVGHVKAGMPYGDQAHPYCWDPTTLYFIAGSFCKGFDHYDMAWNFLLGIPDSEGNTHTNESFPAEPPELSMSDEPSVLPTPHDVSPDQFHNCTIHPKYPLRKMITTLRLHMIITTLSNPNIDPKSQLKFTFKNH